MDHSHCEDVKPEISEGVFKELLISSWGKGKEGKMSFGALIIY